MPRFKEAAAGLALVGVTTGLAACSTSTEAPAPQPTPSIAESKYTPQLTKLATRIFNLTQGSPRSFSSKPPYTVGFDVATADAGTLTFAVQTPSENPDLSKVEMIDIQQKYPDKRIADLTFYILNDGSWSVYCDSPGHRYNERGQVIAQMEGTASYASADHANALLSDSIYSANAALDAASEKPALAQPLPSNLCDVNLGDG